MSKYLARKITTAEGLFVNVEDFKRALMADELVVESAALIKVAKEQGLSPLMGVRLCLANALNEVSGVNAALQRQNAIRVVIEDKRPDAGNGGGQT